MKRIFSFLIAVVMVLAMIPALPRTEAEAATPELVTIRKSNSTIAPGITQEIGTVRKSFNGEQLAYYTMKVDFKNEYAHIYANYKDNEWEPHSNGQYGFQDVMDQMDAAQRNHSDPSSERYIENYTVVGGVNGTGFDMSTGQTRGILVMEGHEAQGDTNKEPFFAILEDGTPHIFWNKNGEDYIKYKDQIQEAINSFVTPLIRGGSIVCSTDQKDENARTALGITENNEVVLLVTDGKQKPTSAGCAMYELALLLKEAGCVDAFNMDGGGSTTYVARPEGESNYRILSSPCDGAPRAVSASLVVVSTAPSSDEFDHASVAADASYITPGGTVNLTATGLNYAGAPVALPGDVTWEMDNTELGEITGSGENVVFTASDSITEPDNVVTITLKHGGKKAGSATVHVVKPNVFSFKAKSYTVPYGKTIPIEFNVAYATESSEWSVTTHEGDIDFSLAAGNEGLGEISTTDGFWFTAKTQTEGDAALVTGGLTATLTCADMLDTAKLTLGRGSEVIQDFEDPSEFGVWDSVDVNKRPTSYVITTDRDVDDNIQISAELATAEEGHVHSGNYSVRVTIDGRNWLDHPCGAGCTQSSIGIKVPLSLGSTNVGAWVWIPDEEVNNSLGPWGDYRYSQGSGVKYDEGHWFYVDHLKTSDNATWLTLNTYLWTDNNNPDIYKKICNKLVFYIDDVQADYSDVHPDREMPEIGAIQQPLPGDGNKTLNRGEVFEYEDTNTVEFVTTVSDPVNLNTTGIDAENIRAYIDGVEVKTTYNAGKVNTTPTELADGVHTLKIYVPDGAGNTTSATRQFRVNSGSKLPTINVTYRTPGVDDKGNVLINSVSYVDVEASDIANVKKVEMDVDLINNALWELEHAEVDPKFTMGYTLDKYENIAKVTFTRIGDWKEGDSKRIASLPLRTWGYDWPMEYDLFVKYEDGHRNEYGLDGQWTKSTRTPEEAWNLGKVPPIQMCIDVDRGVLTYKNDDSEATTVFSVKNIRKDTELYGPFATVQAENPGKNNWHLHTEKQMDNAEATCVKDGYTGRTYCDVCKSVVNWGETKKATGHQYDTVEGLYQCTVCGEKANGVIGGKTYVEGKCLDGWQTDNSYYQNGVKVGSGLHKVKDDDGVERWHTFNESGICTDKDTGYTGDFICENGVYTPVSELPEDSAGMEGKEYYHVELGVSSEKWLSFQKKNATTVTPPAHQEEGMPDVQQQQKIINTVTYHVHEDGRVYLCNAEDTRKCVVSGVMRYTCPNCEKEKDSEKLWWVGHQWDENHVCTVPTCRFVGKDIGKATLNIMGESFSYTGHEIRAAVMVTYDNVALSVRSDKNGLDGYVSYAYNTDIGEATVNIRGEGDFYGNLSGTFKIVPASVDKVTIKQSHSAEENKSTFTITWPEALGAQYYELIRYDYTAGEWKVLGDHLTECSFEEELEFGTEYRYQVAARAVKDGEIYYAAKWSEPVTGVVDHIWGEKTENVDPTCTEDGSYKHKCEICGAEETVTVEKLGHNVQNWNTTREPTVYADGERQGVCTQCGKTITEVIAKLPPAAVGTGGSTSPSVSQETVTNSDGSTTTTTTKADGSKSETTERADGTVTEKNTDKSGVVTEVTKKTDGSVSEKVTQTDGTVMERNSEANGVTAQKTTDARGEVKSAEVVVPKNAETQEKSVVTAPVEVPAAKDAASAPEISVRVEEGLSTNVEIPVTECGPGTVAVVVKPDGTEEVVRDCVIGENGVILGVEGDVTVKIVNEAKSFNDVKPGNWAEDAVKFASARGLLNGTGGNDFSPDVDMSRGMLATVLYRLSYEPSAGGADFSDIPSGEFYSDAVAWAAKEGVVTGYADKTFGPNDDITREQMVTMLYRYAKTRGADTERSGSLAGFPDSGKVGDYAREAMAWAVAAGLINGTGNGTLDPTGTATRAESATVLMRFCEYIRK